MRRILSPLLGLSLLAVATLQGQQVARIQGTVRNVGNNRPIARAFITIVGTGFRAETNSEGFYVLDSMPVGVISLRAAALGFKPHEIAGLRISGGQTYTEDFNLDASAVTLTALPASVTPSVLLRFQLIRPVGTRTLDQAIMPIDSVLRDLFQWTGYRLLAATTLTSDVPVSAKWGGPGESVMSSTTLNVDGQEYSLTVSVDSYDPPRQIKLSVSLTGMIRTSPPGTSPVVVQRKSLLSTTVTVNVGRTVVLGGTQPGGGRGGMAGTLILAVKPEMRSTP